jgi:hypothetical protein
METFTPLVISSKKARKDLERIKKHASELIQHHKDHLVRVTAYQEKVKMEKIAKAQREGEARKVMAEQESKNRESQMTHQKEMLAHEAKLKELDLKHRALNG